ncbi:hypothetical protein [Catenuloplanes atrovinosus]|uniref:Fatty acid desaturase n=1 Tax=Catenuloplanes atrovinosus TaxID=137266 RepID=A0AAE3YUJ5_9ACTN|nr:hypothetical protein [Catenuloplanes atrovinosus]MDR7278926.1 fatty acid desaturase [Catenuloplanes atrovinosus]
MLNDAAELVGYGLLLGFLWFVWPPLVLLGAGLLLVLWANTRPAGSGRFGTAVGAALAAGRAAYQATKSDKPTELRSVA